MKKGDEKGGEQEVLLCFTKENFDREVLTFKQPILVEFWSPWCFSWRVVRPKIISLKKQFQEKLKVGLLNVDEHREIARQFKVEGIPALLLFQGGQLIKRWYGDQPKFELVQAVGQCIRQAGSDQVI